MLQQLLVLIEKGEQFSQMQLADKLGVNLVMLSGMLQHLMQMGYLEDLSCTTADACSDCSAKGGCFAGTSQHIWSLTPKGHQAAHENGN